MTKQNKAYIYALLAVLMWSTVASAFKIALSDLSPEFTLFYASVSATVVLFIFYISEKNKKKFSFRDLKKSWISGLFNPFIYYLILFEAYDLLPAQIAQPLNYTWPIVLTLMTGFIFKEKLKLGVWVGLIVSFLGVILISSQNSSEASLSVLGMALALGSSIIWSIYWILNMKDERSDNLKLFLNFLMGSLFILIYILILDKPWEFSSKGISASIYIGLFEMGITFFVWLKALKLSEQTSKVTNLVFLSPFISFFFIAIILKEDIHLFSILGLGLIILGIFLQKIIKL